MNQAHLEVGAALVYENGMYLISQRRPEDSFGGYWELPGGKITPLLSLTVFVKIGRRYFKGT